MLTTLLLLVACSNEAPVVFDALSDSPSAAAAGASTGGTGARTRSSRDASTASALSVLLVGPEGKSADPTAVTVIFDRPMVALGDLEARTDVPIRCVPAFAGHARWAGTSTAQLVPDTAIPLATETTCTVPAGTRALDGTSLEADHTWSFRTPALTVQDVQTSDDPAAPLRIDFNQPVELDALAEHLSLTDSDGRELAITLARAIDEDAKPLPDQVLVQAKRAPATDYTLTVSAGLQGTAGPLALEVDQNVPFSTYGPLAVSADFGEDPGAVPTDLGFSFEFKNDAQLADLSGRVRWSPEPDAVQCDTAGEGRYAWCSARLRPRTTYTLTLAPGVRDRWGQTLASATSWTITSTDHEPFLDAPDEVRMMPASTLPTSGKLPVRFRNLDALETRVQALDPAAWMRFTTMPRGEGAEGAAAEAKAEAAALLGVPLVQTVKGGRDNTLRAASLDLRAALPTGYGLVKIDASDPTRGADQEAWAPGAPTRGLLLVTDMGVTLKRGANGAFAWVTQLSDGRPVAGARVSFISGGALVGTATTDARGFASAPPKAAPSADQEAVVAWGVVAQKGADTTWTDAYQTDGIEPWYLDVPTGWPSTAPRVWGFTDRGIYRAGDIVHAHAYVRASDGATLSVPKIAAASWSLRDDEGRELTSGTTTVDTHGALRVDARLPATLPPGDHSLQLRVGATTESLPVTVRAYRVPAFRVDVHTASKSVRAGSAVAAQLDARYLFGAPLKNASMTWSTWRRPLTLSPKGWENFSFMPESTDDSWAYSEEREESLTTQQGTTAADGTARFSQALPVAEWNRPWTLLVEGRVRDIDAQELANRVSVDVHPVEAYAAVRVKDWIGTDGQPLAVEFGVVTPEGEARAGRALQVEVVRRTWSTIREKGLDGTWRWVSTAKDDVVTSTTLTSGARAIPWTFMPAGGGYYVVRATSTEGAATSVAEASAWIAGAGTSWARNDQNILELVADRRSYAPGDTAKVLVRAPRAGMRALVTLEREGVLDRRIVTLKSTSDVLSVKLKDTMAPNVYLSVVALDDVNATDDPTRGLPAAWYGAVNLPVSSERELLAVSVAAARSEYRPGENVEVAVEVRGAAKGGRPGKLLANAQVQLWAVDYGVLSLTGYGTPDPHGAFYAERPLGVHTSDSRTQVFDTAAWLAKGGGSAGGGGMLGDARRTFEATPLWVGNLVTDKRGRVTTTFKLPDNLTTFRIMAVVDDGATAFGSGDTEIRTNQPLMVRPALPRFFRARDEALAGVVVHNYGVKPLSITVASTATGAELVGGPQTVEVAAGEAREVSWTIRGFKGDVVTWSTTATAGGERDAVEVRVPILQSAVTDRVGTTGTTTTLATETLAKPKGALPDVGGLDVSVSATALVGMDGSLDYLLHYPHGCLEQTGSAIRAAVIARKLDGKQASGAAPAQLDAWINAGLVGLQRFRASGEGFAYWPGQASYGPASAYALEVLTEARAAGYSVDDALYAQAVEGTRRYVTTPWDDTWWQRTRREVDGAARVRALLALARASQGDAALVNRAWDARAKLPAWSQAQLAETIARMNPKDARGKKLVATLATQAKIEAGRAWITEPAGPWASLWFGDETPTSALLRAMLVADPDNVLVPRLAGGLVQARQGGRWSNTWTTAESMAALADYAARYESGAVRTEVASGGTTLLTADLGKRGLAQTHLPLANLVAGPLTVKSTNGGRVYYEARVSWADPSQPARDEGFTLLRKVEVLDGAGPKGTLTSGARVRVTLQVATPQPRFDVALVDQLPAGLEAIDGTLATTSMQDLAEDRGGDDDGYGFGRRQMNDASVAWYGTYLPPGVQTVTYLARATTPGTYVLPGATIEEMYHPEVHGRTASGSVVVLPRAAVGK